MIKRIIIPLLLILFPFCVIAQSSILGYASSNSRIVVNSKEVRVYAPANVISSSTSGTVFKFGNVFPNSKVNGPSSISIYQGKSYYGANTKLEFLSPKEAVITSEGTYSSLGQSIPAIATTYLGEVSTTNGVKQTILFKVVNKNTNSVLWTSGATLQPIIWGSNNIKVP